MAEANQLIRWMIYLLLMHSVFGKYNGEEFSLDEDQLEDSETREKAEDVNVFKDIHFVVSFDLPGPDYNRSDISDIRMMVQLFSTRFRYMSLNLGAATNYATMETIFTTVAQHNHQVTSNGFASTIQICPVYKLYSESGFADKLTQLFHLTNTTNGIFRGTVHSIILSNFDLTYPGDIEELQNTISLIANRTSMYAIGLHMDVSSCNLHLLNALQLVPNVSSLIFSHPWQEICYVRGVESTLDLVKSTMATCKSIIATKHPNISLGFKTTWPDTNSIGTIKNQTSLAYFWRSLAQYAKQELFAIFIDQAFDDASRRGNSVRKSNGWWTSDLTEKVSDPNEVNLFNYHLHTNLSVCESCCESIEWLYSTRNNDSNIKFNSSLLTLVFDEKFYNDQMTVAKYVPFVQIVSERFEKLLISVSDNVLFPRDLESSEIDFLKAVAVHNKASAACGNHVQKHVAASVLLDISERPNDVEKTVSSISSTLAYIHRVADGTIGHVFVNLQHLDSNWKTALKQLKSIKINLETNGFKLGVVDVASRLEKQESWKHWIRLVFPIADEAYLKFEMSKLSFKEFYLEKDDLSSALHDVLKVHTMFAEAFSSESQNPGIFLDLAPPSKHQVVHEVAAWFWLEANKLAERRNLKMIIGPGIRNMNWRLNNEPFAEWWRTNRNFDNGGYSIHEFEPWKTPDIDYWTDHWQPIQQFIFFLLIPIAISLPLVFFCYCCIYARITRKLVEFRDEEVGFFQGDNVQTTKTLEKVDNITRHVASQPYDSSIEIGLTSVMLDYSKMMGSGTFGNVCMAKIKKQGHTVWAAAKTLHLNNRNEASALRGLLMEIKILTYLGKHENVAQLIGAYTSEIRIGKVYVFLELCHYGSLHGYLRRTYSNDPNQTSENSAYIDLQENLEPPLEEQLLKWSIEIARGMEHISSKFIVHADLATRNVLLDKHKTAKICDFGLSRRMENYQNYVKCGNDPLPWRWMAYESLTNMKFSTKSDVWSYGVTLWEIFNEGKTPYPGITWTCEFTEELKSGFRLSKPPGATDEMFTLMETCWDIDPNKRPDFGMICEMLCSDSLSWKETMSKADQLHETRV